MMMEDKIMVEFKIDCARLIEDIVFDDIREKMEQYIMFHDNLSRIQNLLKYDEYNEGLVVLEEHYRDELKQLIGELEDG